LAQFFQVPYARLFEGYSESDLERMLSAFALKNCLPNRPVVDVLKRHFSSEQEKWDGENACTDPQSNGL
jgi:hypothetical protein